MQLVTVRPNWLTPIDMSLIHRAFKFGQDKLGLANRPEAILVQFDRDMIARDHASGCIVEGTRDPVVMQIARQPLYSLLSTTFHELTHVKQIVFGELFRNAEYVKFQGRYFYERDVPTETRSYGDWVQYMSLPWEIEARASEQRLMSDWGKTLIFPELSYVANSRP